MRFIYEPEVLPPYKSTRIKKVFLLFPTTLCNPNTYQQETRWLEFAHIMQTVDVAHAEDNTYRYWKNTEWATE